MADRFTDENLYKLLKYIAEHGASIDIRQRHDQMEKVFGGHPMNVGNAVIGLARAGYLHDKHKGGFLFEITAQGRQDILDYENKQQEDLNDRVASRNKLMYESELAKQQFDDYNSVKRRANWGFWLSIAAVAISFLQLVCNKS